MMAPNLLLLISVVFFALMFVFWTALRIFGRSPWGVAASLFIVVLVVFAVPLSIGIWVPDMFSSRVRTVASTRLADGTDFQVTQRWGADFYTTELRITLPDGRREIRVLDGDDNKSWQVPLSVDTTNRTVTVTLSGDRQQSIQW